MNIFVDRMLFLTVKQFIFVAIKFYVLLTKSIF